MPRFLILKIEGVMQSWGGHTFEDYRPSNIFPTRSGLLGLLGACHGIDREASERLKSLSASLLFTVRADKLAIRRESDGQSVIKHPLRIIDYHTIKGARNVDGKPRKDPVQSYREYLCDTAFTVAVGNTPRAAYSLDEVGQFVKEPYYTPFLGRRSCPVTRPLFETLVDAEDPIKALEKVPPLGGTIYAEEPSLTSDQRVLLRDVPVYGRFRKFSTRQIFIHAAGGKNVPK
jgi:CRISPR system Cascade subunit CasD